MAYPILKTSKVILLVGLSPEQSRPFGKALAGPGTEHLVLVATPQSKATELPEAGTLGVVDVLLDPTDPTSSVKLCRAIQKKYGRLDALVQATELQAAKTLFPFDTKLWEQAVETSLNARFYCAQAAFEVMRDHGGGAILELLPREGRAPGVILAAAIERLAETIETQGRLYGITAKTWPIDLSSTTTSPAGLKHAGNVALSFLESWLVTPVAAASRR